MPERARQEIIERYSLAGAGRQPVFDQITRLAADFFSVPIALVTVLTRDRQLFRGACGLAGEGTTRSVAFCEYALDRPDVMVVEDAAGDPRFADNPLVLGEPFIRFYAGAPIRVEGGIAVGTLCLIDSTPRQFGPDEQRRLEMMAETVTDLIRLRAGSLATQQRQMELERQTELLRATVENIDEGIAVFAPDLSLIVSNQLFFALFGFDAKLAQHGTSAQDLMRIVAGRGELGPGDPDELVAALLQSIRTTPNRSMHIDRVDGRSLDIWRSTMPDGRFILTVADTTQQRQLGRLKDEFIATVSHELRTPLTSINGSLALLARGLAGPLSERGQQLVRIAYENGDRLKKLIDDLLDIEKLEKGQIEFTFVRLDLGDICAKAVEQNRPYAERLDVRLVCEGPSEPLCVKGDELRLLQALSNLISNGAKFSPGGSVVTVRTRRTGARGRIEVADTGSGIPEEFRPRLFQRFAQAPGTQRAGHPGTGLGLAITRSIVEKHGGRIDYSSEVGRGTTFVVEIPLASTEPAGAAREEG